MQIFNGAGDQMYALLAISYGQIHKKIIQKLGQFRIGLRTEVVVSFNIVNLYSH